MTRWLLVSLLVIVLVRQRRHRRAGRPDLDREVPDHVDLVVAGLRAGLSPEQSFRLAVHHSRGRLKSTLSTVLEAIENGSRFPDALRALRGRAGPDLDALAQLLATGDRLGLPLERHAMLLADEARHRRRRSVDAEARELPVRLTVPVVACILPAFVIVVIVPLIVGTLARLSTFSP